MTTHYRHPLSLLSLRPGAWLLAALCALLLSCSDSDDNGTGRGGGKADGYPVSLTLKMGALEQKSLAPLTDTLTVTRDGEAWENSLDIARLKVLLFASDGKFLLELRPDRILSLSPTSTLEWRVEGTLTEAPQGAFTLAILAHWPQVPTLQKGVTTLASILQSGEYPYTNLPYELSATRLMPLYGVTTVASAAFRQGEMTNIGSVDLLRAMARVDLQTDINGATLSEVRMFRYNTQGTCAPTGMTQQTAYALTPHLPAAGQTPDDHVAPFFRLDSTHWRIYLPEYDNITDTTRCCAISFSLKVNESYTQRYTRAIDFRDYNNGGQQGNRFNILRDHAYRFTIKSVSNPPLHLIYEVQQSERHDINIPSFE